MALTPKQERFVQEYLVDLNATQAAIRAGYTKKRASELGYQLLQKTTVQVALKAAMDRRARRTEITQDMVLEEIGKVAFKPAADVADSELKYANKLRALEMLAKHLGMFSQGAAGGDADRADDDPITRALKEEAEHGLL